MAKCITPANTKMAASSQREVRPLSRGRRRPAIGGASVHQRGDRHGYADGQPDHEGAEHPGSQGAAFDAVGEWIVHRTPVVRRGESGDSRRLPTESRPGPRSSRCSQPLHILRRPFGPEDDRKLRAGFAKTAYLGPVRRPPFDVPSALRSSPHPPMEFYVVKRWQKPPEEATY